MLDADEFSINLTLRNHGFAARAPKRHGRPLGPESGSACAGYDARQKGLRRFAAALIDERVSA